MDKSVAEEMVGQYHLTWVQLRDVVRKFPDSEWRRSNGDRLVPARLACSLLRSGLVPCSEQQGADFRRAASNGDSCDEVAPEDLPSREDVLAHIAEFEANTAGWLLNLGDEGLLKAEDPSPVAGPRPLTKAVCYLRRMEWQIGELSTLLRQRGNEHG